jgi:phosphinothricin acetyltransferase
MDVGLATVEDLPAIVAINNHVAETSIANFATRPVSVAEQRPWFDRHAASGPYRLLVARSGPNVLGYAASGPYREHEAFRHTVEVSVSLHHTARRQGIGSALYSALFEHLAGEAVHVAVAGIAVPNDASVALHRKFGFTEVGTFTEYAVKNDQYVSSLWMQRIL